MLPIYLKLYRSSSTMRRGIAPSSLRTLGSVALATNIREAEPAKTRI